MNFSRPYGTGVCSIAYPALKRRAIARLSLRDSKCLMCEHIRVSEQMIEMPAVIAAGKNISTAWKTSAQHWGK